MSSPFPTPSSHLYYLLRTRWVWVWVLFSLPCWRLSFNSLGGRMKFEREYFWMWLSLVPVEVRYTWKIQNSKSGTNLHRKCDNLCDYQSMWKKVLLLVLIHAGTNKAFFQPWSKWIKKQCLVNRWPIIPDVLLEALKTFGIIKRSYLCKKLT